MSKLTMPLFLKLAVIALLAPMASVSFAQAQPVNPFARPAPASAASAAMPGAAGAAPRVGALARPGQNGSNSVPQSQFPTSNPGIPMSGFPAAMGMPGSSATPTPEAEELPVNVTWVGTVNGLRVLKGADSYHFEATSKRKVKIKPVLTGTAGASLPSNLSAQVPPPLPSMVGRPAPVSVPTPVNR